MEEIENTKEQWKQKAIDLWTLLDDIDTAGDMFRPELNAYFGYVNDKAMKRHAYLYSDGYTLININR